MVYDITEPFYNDSYNFNNQDDFKIFGNINKNVILYLPIHNIITIFSNEYVQRIKDSNLKTTMLWPKIS